MSKATIDFDTSRELIVTRYGNGIKLVRPEQYSYSSKKNNRHSSAPLIFGNLLNIQSFNIFLLNTAGEIQAMNEAEAEICGYDSIYQGLGMTVFSIAMRSTAEAVRKNDYAVMHSQQFKLFDEYFVRLHDLIVNFLVIKFPWYDADNKLIGIFGFSITLGRQLVSEALLTLSNLNIYTTETNQIASPMSGVAYKNVHFSKRETDVLYYTIRGQTAKQIANVLHLSHRTVEQYLENMKNKLGVITKSQLIEAVIDKFI